MVDRDKGTEVWETLNFFSNALGVKLYLSLQAFIAFLLIREHRDGDLSLFEKGALRERETW